MNVKTVNAAVRIKLAIERNNQGVLKIAKLSKDLRRLTDSMTPEEYSSYKERTK